MAVFTMTDQELIEALKNALREALDAWAEWDGVKQKKRIAELRKFLDDK